MKLYLKNIGKISEANVEINGITVIGGENNTGKSTIGKSLFSIFSSFYEIQQQIRRERLLSIKGALQAFYQNVYVWMSGEMKDIDEYSADILSKAKDYIESPELLKKELDSIMKHELMPSKLFINKMSTEEIVSQIIDILKIPDEAIFNSVVSKKINAEFNGQVLNIYSETEGIISLIVRQKELRINISEGAAIASGFNDSLHTEVIYIDDPFVLDDINFRSFHRKTVYSGHREQLMTKLLSKGGNESVVNELVAENKFEKIYKRIVSVCDGNIIVQQNGRLAYRLNNADKSLSVINLSTGLKTFVILKTLLTNGTIERNGIVILDEPEIHLHPELQLLFAELIVLLNKEFGVNILLNTHSPYFLRAIQVYSAKYEMSDMCKYYLADFNEEKRVCVTDVTDCVDKIYVKLSKPLQVLEDTRWGDDQF